MTQSSGVQWKRYDPDNKGETSPPHDGLVWITESFYEGGVTCGFFDGYTFRTWTGSDDCNVEWWAPIELPTPPADWKLEQSR